MFIQVPFVFGDPSELVKPAERKVAAVMGCYWTNFAWNSHPNNATGRTPLYSQKLCDKLPSWEVRVLAVNGCSCRLLTVHVMCVSCSHTCMCMTSRDLTYTCTLSPQHTTQPEFRRIVFNITDEDARIDMVPVDALTHSRCGFWAEME